MNALTKLRKLLHAHAELSCQEKQTRELLKNFLNQFLPTRVLEVAEGKALLIEFDSGTSGPHILYRADLDALPIQEEGITQYASVNPGVSHKCGHDGHMTLACSIPEIWNSLEQKAGKLGLLFQHAEEVAIGAKEIVADPIIKKWEPDFIFGLHNLPGFAVDEVLLAYEEFSCASVGLRIAITGSGSHAGEPEKGVSPLPLLVELSKKAENFISLEEDDNFFLSTLVHLKLGEENYGIMPGEGKVCFTLRAKKTALLLLNKEELINEARKKAAKQGFKVEVSEFDFFPATLNSKNLVDLLHKSSAKAGLKPILKEFPFRWSEDFGFYSELCPTAYFGIGNGRDSFPLHHPSYDFNEQIITRFQDLFKQVLLSIPGVK